MANTKQLPSLFLLFCLANTCMLPAMPVEVPNNKADNKEALSDKKAKIKKCKPWTFIHTLESVKKDLAKIAGKELNQAGDSILHLVCDSPDYDIDLIVLLLQAGESPLCINYFGKTPFFEAVSRGDHDIVQAFLEVKPSVDLAGPNKVTPMHIACLNGHASIICLLIAAGASLKAQDALYGWTPLHWAISQSNIFIVEILLAANTPLDIKDLENRTPLQLAEHMLNNRNKFDDDSDDDLEPCYDSRQEIVDLLQPVEKK